MNTRIAIKWGDIANNVSGICKSTTEKYLLKIPLGQISRERIESPHEHSSNAKELKNDSFKVSPHEHLESLIITIIL